MIVFVAVPVDVGTVSPGSSVEVIVDVTIVFVDTIVVVTVVVAGIPKPDPSKRTQPSKLHSDADGQQAPP